MPPVNEDIPEGPSENKAKPVPLEEQEFQELPEDDDLDEDIEELLQQNGESKNQSWALAHFSEVRYPLPTQFFPMDRLRSCVYFLNFSFRSSLKRLSLNQWFAERKRAKSLIALY